MIIGVSTLGRVERVDADVVRPEFDADLAEEYGLVNRALPAAEPWEFADRPSGRIATFPRSDAQREGDLRADVPVGEEHGLLPVAFRSTTRPTPATRWREASSARSWWTWRRAAGRPGSGRDRAGREARSLKWRGCPLSCENRRPRGVMGPCLLL
jgi:hypothetical protein